MILYTAVTICTVCLAFLVREEGRACQRAGQDGVMRRRYVNRVCLAAIFVILFSLSALRIGIGNDYPGYVDTFHELYNGYDPSYIVTEPGFNLLVRTLYTLAGGEQFVLVFAVFAFLTVFLFLKALYEQSADFGLAFLLFMALGLYFRTFNTVRYYLALAAAFYALRYVLKKEYWKFAACILLAALFHKSVLFVLPVYLLAALPWKKWHIALGAFLGAGVYLSRPLIMKLVLKIYDTYQDTPYLTQGVGLRASLPGLLRCGLVLALGLVCFREAVKDNRANRLYFQLNLAAIGLYVFGSFLPLVSRLGYYLITPQILLVPGVLRSIGDDKKRKRLTVLVLLCAVCYFIYFLLTADQEGIRVLPYRSWLFEGRDWLLESDVL